MRLTDLLTHAGLAQPLTLDPVITGITADSRQVQPGFVFAALPGAKLDGSTFIADAAVKGAVAILAPEGVVIPNGIVALRATEPRLALAKLVATFYAPAPHTLVAVTGTNGKTSTVNFVQQLWAGLGHQAASLGTLGIRGPGVDKDGSLTTPDAVTLAQDLQYLAAQKITHAALEASSHGLHQYRLDGLTLKAAGFTYLGRDHLDYHGSMENYLAAKALLFSRLLPATGTAVLNADIPEYPQLKAICQQRGQQVLTYGREADLKCLSATPQPDGLDVRFDVLGQRVEQKLNVTGSFQAGNILCALGLVIGSGTAADKAIAALANLRAVAGRLELVASAQGAGIYVDYAHTPDALETVLKALRAHTTGRLWVVFGCGGNRDPGKRPLMGAIADRLADEIIITDDNPRLEDPALIRAAIAKACPRSCDIGDRAKAIQSSLNQLKPGDTLLIAGKGHEQGQIVGHEVRPFDDATVVRVAVGERVS